MGSKTRFEMLVRFGLTIWLGSWAFAACGQSVEEAAEWGAGEVYGAPHPRAALRVRAHIGGFVCPMQLDTGANAAVIWHDWNDRRAGAESAPGPDVNVEFAGIRKQMATTLAFYGRLSHCDGAEVVGTLGSGFFDQGTLTVDTRAPAVRYQAGGALAGNPEAQIMVYLRIGAQGGVPLVQLRGPDAVVRYALLDTGSAALEWVVPSEADWLRATGKSALTDVDVQHFEVSAWGRMLPCVAARAPMSLRIGNVDIDRPRVTYCAGANNNNSQGTAGVIGLEPFFGRIVVFDFVSNLWLVGARPQ